jgi:hypothetical protein
MVENFMRNCIVFVFLIIAAFSLTASAQEKFSAKVLLYVQHDSKAIQEEMTSYVSRELRSLGDVEIVQNDYDYAIHIVLVDVVIGNKKSGFAISISFLKSAKCTFKEKYFDGTPVIGDCDASLWGTTAAISLDNLRQTAQSLVTKFDSKILEAERSFFNKNKKSGQINNNSYNLSKTLRRSELTLD